MGFSAVGAAESVLTGVGLPASPPPGDKCYPSTLCRETKHSLLLESDSVNVPFVF